MANIWHQCPKDQITPEQFLAVIEISKGGKVKYELDKGTGFLRMDRILYTSTQYPANYGFVPRTLAKDKDPLDVLVLCSEGLLPLCLVACYPIGVLCMEDNGKRDEKIIAIPLEDPNYNQYQDMEDLPSHYFSEIKHFFTVYKDLEDQATSIHEILGPRHAKDVLQDCISRYNRHYPPTP